MQPVADALPRSRRGLGGDGCAATNLIPQGIVCRYFGVWRDGLQGRRDVSFDTVTQRPAHVYEVYIRTTAERLWAAITSPEYTRRYFYGGWFESSWQPGSPYRTLLDDGTTPFEGTLLEVDPPRRLAYTFRYVGDEQTRTEQPSRVTWQIAQLGDACKLTVVHDQFAEGETFTFAKVGGGWPYILSNLKTLLETGSPLPLRVSA
jgi:uncharacterized protein YndB with AHSA1/START domain